MEEKNSIFPSWDILTFEKLDVKISFLRLKSYFRRAAIYYPSSSSYSRLYPISQHRVSLSMFKNLWKTLTVQEKKKLENHLMRFYLFLLQKSFYDKSSTSSDLRTTFIEIFNYLARTGLFGSSFDFLGMCSKSMCVELQDILRMVPRHKLRFILFGFLFRRFGKTTLSSMTSSGELSIGILSYGCLYGYHGGYFNFILKKLLRVGILKGQRVEYEEITFGKNFIGNLRLQLAVEVLLPFFQDELELEFMSMLWKTLPFPYVTRKEMLNFLITYTYVKKEIFEKCDLLAKHNVYPFPDVMEPRSLKHLSRCQILKCLHLYSRVGDKAIPSLDIPDTLKGYLMLDEF